MFSCIIDVDNFEDIIGILLIEDCRDIDGLGCTGVEVESGLSSQELFDFFGSGVNEVSGLTGTKDNGKVLFTL
jgi:hypothetical protein